MTLDPTFDFNPDLGDQENIHDGMLFLTCFGGHDYIATPDGLQIDLDNQVHTNYVQRERGETVRGAEVIGAALITQPTSSGQPEIIQDRRGELASMYVIPPVDDGFGCQQRADSRPDLTLLLLGLLLLQYTRRRSAA
jgi:hypothetical protein